MTHIAPVKPGPHLHPATPINVVLPDVVDRPSFRELAKRHAREASRLLEELPDLESRDQAEFTLDHAMAHAMVSQACANVAPVARQRLTPCKAGAK